MKIKKKYTFSNIGDRLYFYSLIIYLVYSLISVSMFTEIVPSKLITLFLMISMAGFLAHIVFFNRYTSIEAFFGLIMLTLVLYILKFDGYRDPLLIFILIFSSKNVDFKRVVKYYFIISSIVLLLITIASQYHFIADLVFSRDGIARHSLGMVYPTVYSSRFFFLVLAYIFLCRFKLNVFEVLSLLGLNYWIYLKTNARLDFYIIIIIVLFFFLLRYVNFLVKKISWVCVILPSICLLIIVFLSIQYGKGGNLYYELNNVFSNRLQMGNLAFQLYDIKPLGQYMYLQGNGGRQGINNLVNQYFYLDSGYLVLLFEYGSIFTILSLGLLLKKLSNLLVKKYNYLLYIFGIISIYTIISGSLFHLANVFILFIYAQYEEEEYLKSEMKEHR